MKKVWVLQHCITGKGLSLVDIFETEDKCVERIQKEIAEYIEDCTSEGIDDCLFEQIPDKEEIKNHRGITYACDECGDYIFIYHERTIK